MCAWLPRRQSGCENQVFKTDEGCGKTLDNWIAGLMKSPPGKPAPKPSQPGLVAKVIHKFKAWKEKDKDKAKAASAQKHRMTMGQLPPECETVLHAPVPAVPVTAMQ